MSLFRFPGAVLCTAAFGVSAVAVGRVKQARLMPH